MLVEELKPLAKYARVLTQRSRAVVRTLRSMAKGLIGVVYSFAVAWG